LGICQVSGVHTEPLPLPYFLNIYFKDHSEISFIFGRGESSRFTSMGEGGISLGGGELVVGLDVSIEKGDILLEGLDVSVLLVGVVFIISLEMLVHDNVKSN
jgi:hypothetical protein